MATEPTAGRAMAGAPGGDTRDPTRPVIPDAVFCAPCRVGESFGGLGVFTTAAVKAGSIMHVERPFVWTTSWRQRLHVCAACMGEAVDSAELPFPCESCASLAYCSASCAEAAAAAGIHSELECGALAAWSASDDEAGDEGVADLVVQAIRILAHRHDGTRVRPFQPEFMRGEAGAAGELTVGYESYVARLQGMRRSKRTSDAIKRAVRAALRAMPPKSRVPPSELFDVLDRHQSNVFGLMGPGASSLGLASFVGAMYLMNHSCYPNASFDCRPLRQAADGRPTTVLPAASDAVDGTGFGPVFAMRALVDIPKGREILHCYAGSADGPARRQQYVLDHHGFECACERCSCDDPVDEADLSESLEAMRCNCIGCGTGLSYPLLPPEAPKGASQRRCVHCGGVWDEDSDDE